MTWALIVFLLLASGMIYEVIAGRLALRRFPPPGKTVLVNGRNFHFNAVGKLDSVQPLVVFEPGLMFWSRFYDPVTSRLTGQCRCFSYDRAGYGWSQASRSPRSPACIAEELHLLLAAAGEKPPYLLVGHSMGGIYVGEFYRRYPNEVSGMVLLDSAHEKQFEFLPGARAETGSLRTLLAALLLLAGLGIIRAFLQPLLLKNFSSVKGQMDEEAFKALGSSPSFFITGWREASAFLDRKGFPGDTPNLDDLPLAVIRARYPDEPPGRMPVAKYRELVNGWARIQQDLASRSSRGRLIAASQPGHNLMHVEPELIVKTILEMLKKS